jgi:hypothetical protein
MADPPAPGAGSLLSQGLTAAAREAGKSAAVAKDKKPGVRRSMVLTVLVLVLLGGYVAVDGDSLMGVITGEAPKKKTKKKGKKGKKGSKDQALLATPSESGVSEQIDRLARSRGLRADHGRALLEGQRDDADGLLDELRSLELEAENLDLMAAALLEAFQHDWAAGREMSAEALLGELQDVAKQQGTLSDAVGDDLAEALSAHHALLPSSKAERQEALLGDLDELVAESPTPKRESALARALYNTHARALDQRDPDRAEAAMDELRRLALGREDVPDDVSDAFSRGLYNAHHAACAAGDVDGASRLMGELRGTIDLRWASAESKTRYARALFNEHFAALQAGRFDDASVVLDELRLVAEHPAIEHIQRHELLRALFNAHQDASAREAEQHPAALLDELRQLCARDDAREIDRVLLAKSLYDASRAAYAWGRAELSGQLLDELRALAHRPEASDDLRLQLANGLYNAHTVAADVGHASLAGSLLEEIRELARYADAAHPLRLFLNSGMLDSRVDG